MDYFKLPTGYDCFSRTGSDIYGYKDNARTRDTYQLINYKWEKVQSQTNQYGYSIGTCLTTTDYLIPEDMLGSLFVAAAIAAATLVFGLFKVFSR